MENKLIINKNQLEEIKSDVNYIGIYNEALHLEFNKEEQYEVYIKEKIGLIEKHLNNIKQICNI